MIDQTLAADADARAAENHAARCAAPRLGARMVPFAGCAMPVQDRRQAARRGGVLAEHLQCRGARGAVRRLPHGPGEPDRRRRRGGAGDGWCPATSPGLAPGRQRYTLLTNDTAASSTT